MKILISFFVLILALGGLGALYWYSQQASEPVAAAPAPAPEADVSQPEPATSAEPREVATAALSSLAAPKPAAPPPLTAADVPAYEVADRSDLAGHFLDAEVFETRIDPTVGDFRRVQVVRLLRHPEQAQPVRLVTRMVYSRENGWQQERQMAIYANMIEVPFGNSAQVGAAFRIARLLEADVKRPQSESAPAKIVIKQASLDSVPEALLAYEIETGFDRANEVSVDL
ncbi:MAG: hypothetical protein ACOCVG_03450 [Verrucomicrobiota bacterium]